MTRPFIGHFGSYQGAVMAAMARNMARENFSDLLRPKTDLLIFENTKSLHLNQYPFPSVLAGLGSRFLGGGLEFWGRFQAMVFNGLSILLLGLLAARLFSERVAWIAAALFSFSPYTLIYGQSFLSESLSLFMFLLALWILLRRDRLSLGTVLGSALALSIALAGRIHFMIFFPVFILCLLKQKASFRQVLIFTAMAFLAPAAWYGFTYVASRNWTNLHTSIFLQIGVPTSHPDDALHQYFQKLSKLFFATMLTPLLFPFFIWGWKPLAQFKWGFRFATAGVLAGITVVLLAPRKVMDHDFYLYAMFPFVVLVAATGLADFLERLPVLKKRTYAGLGLLGYLLLSLLIAWRPLYETSPGERHALQVAQSVRLKTLPEDRLIVAGRHPAVMLFYADRPCWNMDLNAVGKPLGGYLKNPRFRKAEAPEIARIEAAMKNPVSWLEYYRAKGAAYLVTSVKADLESVPDFLTYLKANFQIVSGDTDNFYLFRL